MIRLTDLLKEDKSWCESPQFKEFVDYLEKWQSHSTYRSVNIKNMIKSYNKLDVNIKREIQASDREVNSSYSALDMDALWDTNKITVASFTNKEAAKYFSKQLTGNAVISGKRIKDYTLAISYPKVVQNCRNNYLGDDEGEILIIQPEFDKKWLKDYWTDFQRRVNSKKYAKENLHEFLLDFNGSFFELAKKYDLKYERDNLYKTYFENPTLQEFRKNVKIHKQVDDDGMYKEDLKDIRAYIKKYIDTYLRKTNNSTVKSFFKELKREAGKIKLTHPNVSKNQELGVYIDH